MMKNVSLVDLFGVRVVAVAIVVTLCFLFIGGSAKVAKADPHGVFYTAIGQQQLFFNVLAALDQADYVETAFDREKRRKAREAVTAEQPFIKETESGARFTEETELEPDGEPDSQTGKIQPGTPALLNRQVTVEGHDLYTDELVREFGAESARRNAAAELLQTLCAYGYGIVGCDNDTSQKNVLQKHEILQQRRAATVIDPLEWSQMPYINGMIAALNSGNPVANIDNPHPNNINPIGGGLSPLLTDEEYRAGKLNSPDIFGWEPWAYSKTIAEWRARGFNDQIQTYVENEMEKILPEDKRIPFFDVTTDTSGNIVSRCLVRGNNDEIELDPACGLDPQLDYGDFKFIAAADALFMPETITEIGDKAASRIAIQQAMAEDEGVLADTTLVSHPVTIRDTNGNIITNSRGELTIKTENPVAVRKADIYGIPNVLGNLATSQQASALTGLDVPGAVQLVKRATAGQQQADCDDGQDNDGDGDIDHSGGPGGEPADSDCGGDPNGSEAGGQQASSLGSTGQVAGALDFLFDDKKYLFDQPKEKTSPSANIISPILEFGARHALRVMTAGTWRPGSAGITCGYTCD